MDARTRRPDRLRTSPRQHGYSCLAEQDQTLGGAGGSATMRREAGIGSRQAGSFGVFRGHDPAEVERGGVIADVAIGCGRSPGGG